MSSKAATLILLALLAVVPPAAGAVCPNTTETAEQTLFNVFGCSASFINWFRPYFNLQSDHWDEGWGLGYCNTTQAFTKMVDSGYLLTYGLRDSTLGPWHSNLDYFRWAAGSKHDFRYEPEYSFEAYASSFAGFWQTNRVEMQCLSFNNRTAGARAGTMLHEATHIIYWQWSHGINRPGSNCGSTKCTDDWFFHYVNSYGYGQLAGRKHSMTQIQIEYLCDLGEFAQPWVPAAIATAAKSESNDRMSNRIRNPPSWSCGLPRPIPTPPQPRACPLGEKCCGVISNNVCQGECEPLGELCP